jgi:hypothetical protein
LKQLPERAFLPQIKADEGEREMDTDEGLCGTVMIVRYGKYHLPRSGAVVNLRCAVSFIRLKKAASVYIYFDIRVHL